MFGFYRQGMGKIGIESDEKVPDPGLMSQDSVLLPQMVFNILLQMFSHKILSCLIEKVFQSFSLSIAMAKNILIYNLWSKHTDVHRCHNGKMLN